MLAAPALDSLRRARHCFRTVWLVLLRRGSWFALRLAERLDAFLLPPFLADALRREERLLGAMVQPTKDYGIETTASWTFGRDDTKHGINRTALKFACHNA